MIQKNRWACTAVLCGCTGLAAVVSLQFGAWRAALFTGSGVALSLALPSYWSLSWALHRSNKVFYSVFVGGVFFRLTGLALTAYAVYRHTRMSLGLVLLTVVGMLVVLSGIESYFIQREDRLSLELH